MKAHRDQLLAVVIRSLPAKAKVFEVAWVGDLDLMISWPLKVGVDQQTTRLIAIHISILHAAVIRYMAAPTESRRMANERLRLHLKARLKRLDTARIFHPGQLTAMVRWRVSPNTLFG